MPPSWLTNLKAGDEVLVEKPAYGIAALCKIESVDDVIVTVPNAFHGSGYSHSKNTGASLPKGKSGEQGEFVLKQATPENIAPYLRGRLREAVHDATAPGKELLPLETLQQLAAICKGARQ